MQPDRARPLLRVGDVIRVREDDYLYGAGELRLRVTQVPDVEARNFEWLELRGVAISTSGREADHDRPAMVRVAALARPGTIIRPRPERR